MSKNSLTWVDINKIVVVTGIGKVSFLLKRFVPKIYEHLMTNKMKAGLDH